MTIPGDAPPPERTSPLLAAGGLLVVAGAALVVVSGAPRPAPEARRSESFQSLVGGLGTGAVRDLQAGRHAFDPRLACDPSGAGRGLRLRTVGADLSADLRQDD